MHRRPIIIVNWKNQITPAEASILIHHTSKTCERVDDIEIVALPSAVTIITAVENLRTRPHNLHLGLQNFYPSDNEVTGENSLSSFRGLARYVLIGQYDRRRLFDESDSFLNKKLAYSLDHNFIPIYCVSETQPGILNSRHRGRPTRDQRANDINKQLELGLAKITAHAIEKMVFCYEPIWSESKGFTGIQAQAACEKIRSLIAKKTGNSSAQRVRIVVRLTEMPKNIAEFSHQPDIDGLLLEEIGSNQKNLALISSNFVEGVKNQTH